ncbi:MAG: nitrilase, partial [Erythrobacter sp.]|nr:nitrilase [Erythrobacter sp.]
MTRIAVLQMTSGIDPEANFSAIAEAARNAAGEGAAVLFTPEMSLLIDRNRARAAAHIMPQNQSPFVPRFAALAAETGMTIAVGSMAVRHEAGDKNANRSMFFAPGAVAPVTYDKIHMFDVDLASGESWRESNAYEAGRAVVTIDSTPLGRLGLTVCYDLRFPALFGALGDRACDAIAVPAAFTRP